MGAEQHDARLQRVAVHRADDVDAPEARHLDVEYRDIRRVLADRAERRAPVRRLPDQLELGPRPDSPHHRFAVERMIVGHKDPDPACLVVVHPSRPVKPAPPATTLYC
jgi:hypothetical protein